VLCKGNICRSPFAARWLQAKVSEQNISLEISSAGLDAFSGKEAHPLAAIVSRDYGIDLARHRTAAVSAELVANADVILVMELAHIRQLHARFPDARRKTFLLGHFAQERPLTDIQDPYGHTREEFARCYSRLSAACDGFLVHLRNQVHPNG
jgi:protein-tyrosine phosphatase